MFDIQVEDIFGATHILNLNKITEMSVSRNEISEVYKISTTEFNIYTSPTTYLEILEKLIYPKELS